MAIHQENMSLTPILSWLTVVLQERFGLAKLRLDAEASHILLTIQGEKGSIKLPTIHSSFLQNNSALTTFLWDAKSEGFTSILNQALTAIAVEKPSQPFIKKEVHHYTVQYDILGLTYWMLARVEELDRSVLDQHERFPATESHAFQHQYLERPIVDEWLDILRQVIVRQWPNISLKIPVFSIKVSHDVDIPSRFGMASFWGLLVKMGAETIKRKNLKGAITAPLIWLDSKQRLSDRDPDNSFTWLMDVSEKNNLKSAFYFFSERTGFQHDAEYDLGHPAIRHLLRTIHHRGHEIGLHPSYRTFQQPELIARQAQKLQEICAEEGIGQKKWGGRMHFLKWNHPLTLNAWNEAGMAYDSTLGFADAPGFRCGTSYEYPAFDPVANKMLQLRIRPLIAMECTVIQERYLNLGYTDQALAKFQQLKNTCKRVGGCFTLLWHNDLLKHPNSKNLYRQVIET